MCQSTYVQLVFEQLLEKQLVKVWGSPPTLVRLWWSWTRTSGSVSAWISTLPWTKWIGLKRPGVFWKLPWKHWKRHDCFVLTCGCVSIQFDLFCTSFCIETCLQSCPRQTMQTNKRFVFCVFNHNSRKWGRLGKFLRRPAGRVLASAFVGSLFLFSLVELSNWVLRRAWVINLRFDLKAIASGLLAESSAARNR